MDIHEEVYRQYMLGNSMRGIERDLGVSRRNVRSILTEKGVRIKTSGEMKSLPVNHDVFDEINEQSAYWIGFLAADGNIYNNKVKLMLSEKD